MGFWSKFVLVVSVLAAIAWLVNFTTGVIQPFALNVAHSVQEWTKAFALLGELQNQVEGLGGRVEQLEEQVNQYHPPTPPDKPPAESPPFASVIKMAIGAALLILMMVALNQP